MTATTHNPSEEPCWVSCLRENFMSSSYGEELETGPAARSGTAPVPHPTANARLDQPRPPRRTRLRALRPIRRRVYPSRYDPHHAPPIDQPNSLLLNPN